MGQLAIVSGSTIYIFNECHIDVRIFQSLLEFPPYAYKIYTVVCFQIFYACAVTMCLIILWEQIVKCTLRFITGRRVDHMYEAIL
jgi:hypothetical protein